MKFGQIIRDEQKSCLFGGAQIEMFDFFIDYKRLKKLLRHLGSGNYISCKSSMSGRIEVDSHTLSFSNVALQVQKDKY